MIDHLSLQNIDLVVHDFGGPIALPLVIDEPDKFRSITFINTWMFGAEDDPAFQKMKPVLKSPFLPILYRYLNFSARFLLPASFGAKKLEGRVKRQYTSPFSLPSEREGPLALARALLNEQPYFNALWEKRSALAHLPKLFVWGMADKAVTPRNLKKFYAEFPNSTVVELTDCGHFPQEEEPEAVIEALMGFYAHINIQPIR